MNAPMLAEKIHDRRAWSAAGIDESEDWYYRLPQRCLAAIAETIGEFRRHPRPVTEVDVAGTHVAACTEHLQPPLAALEAGRGFVIIEGVAADRYSPAETQTLYWIVGQLLGRPFAQNVQGTLLYDVRDTGQDLTKGARFSVTNYESSFHTDNSFGESVLDYVGLLCLQTARAGGLSQVVSGFAVHNELLEHHADVLPVLYQPFHVDRRGGVREGESPTVRLPIIRWDSRELTFRYLRYWIEAGHQKAGEPLTAAQVHALDVLDSVLRRPELRVEFALRRGDMFFINNRWILHNRTAFEDYPEIDRRRHLVRLWLKA